jgi:hypothetical protein
MSGSGPQMATYGCLKLLMPCLFESNKIRKIFRYALMTSHVSVYMFPDGVGSSPPR